MKESVMCVKSKEFALDIINVYKSLSKQENVMSRQLLRSATSIGANIREANYASSKADFINKLQIALKECYETEYWLELLTESGYYDTEKYLLACGVLRAMLVKSINTARKSLE